MQAGTLLSPAFPPPACFPLRTVSGGCGFCGVFINQPGGLVTWPPGSCFLGGGMRWLLREQFLSFEQCPASRCQPSPAWPGPRWGLQAPTLQVAALLGFGGGGGSQASTKQGNPSESNHTLQKCRSMEQRNITIMIAQWKQHMPFWLAVA